MKKLITPAVLILIAALCLTGMASAESAGNLTAKNLEITTYRGISAGGRLSAAPDDGALTYEIVTPPAKGSVELGEDGCFVYTPNEKSRGRDYFGYKATDGSGSVSQEATVIIRIKKQKTAVCYADLSGSGAEYSAVELAERGVFVGESLAGEYVFSPDAEVSRAEFLAMCMKLSGRSVLTGVRSTSFADDDSIPVWAKPYVSTALKCGVISGYSSGESGAVFSPERSITAAEAAVILDKALEITDVSPVWMREEEIAVPVWAGQSAANLIACGVMPDALSVSAPALTRAQAAEMLVSAMAVLDKR